MQQTHNLLILGSNPSGPNNIFETFEQEISMSIGPLQEAYLQTLEANLHEQTDSVLCHRYGSLYKFCCLGVGLEVLIENGIDIEVGEDDDGDVCYNNYDTYLPKEGVKGLAFYEEDGTINSNLKAIHKFIINNFDKTIEDVENVGSLASFNDSLELTFPQIAAVIRKFPRSFFKKAV